MTAVNFSLRKQRFLAEKGVEVRLFKNITGQYNDCIHGVDHNKNSFLEFS